jgi:PQQ-like domain
MSRQGGPGHTAGEIEPVLVPQGGPVLTQPAVWIHPQDGTTWTFIANDYGIAGMQLFVDADGNPTIFAQWSRAGAGDGGTSPVVANGILYYAGGGGLHALDPVTGATLFSDPRLGAVHWQSPIVVNGRLYLTDLDGSLWAWEPPAPGLTFHPLGAACTLVDTRGAAGPGGGPALAGGATRTVAAAGQCGVPEGTLAVAAEVTAFAPPRRGNLQVTPANVTSTAPPALRFRRNQTVSAQASVPLTGNPVGSLSVTAHLAGSVDFALAVTGYYD